MNQALNLVDPVREKRIQSGGGASAREGLIHSDLLQRFIIPVAERRSSEVNAYLVTCDDNRLVSSPQSL
jgi:hypothetical protein